MADLTQLKCKQCGAPLEQSAVANGAICCKYCGEVMIIESPKSAHVEAPVEPQIIYREIRQPQQEAPQHYAPAARYGTKSKSVAILLALFLGCWGAHWFYLNRKKKATTMFLIGFFGSSLLFPLVVTGVWALADIIGLLSMSDEAFNETYNRIS